VKIHHAYQFVRLVVNYDKCIGCKYCSWACPYGARELDEQQKVMKKCTLCVDRIYDMSLPEDRRKPSCVLTCPTNARLFGDVHDSESEVSRIIREQGGYQLMPEWDFTLFKINEQINIDLSILVAVVGSMACFVLFFCTGMIYACIKFLQEWATVLTVVNFTVLGTASGFTLAALLAFFHAPELLNVFAGWAIVFTILGAITRIASLIRNYRLKPKSTPKSAIGIRHSKIKQTAQGAMGGSFNTREYFHGQTEDIVKHIKWSFLIMVFPVPLLLLTIGLIFDFGTAFILAAIVQYVGLIAERWFFFAQARHPQNIYYQAT
jgi:ferredoxin/DMSO reductase anchor subunit